MFRHNQNLVITGGRFTNIQNNATTYDAVSTALWQEVATGAMFDSVERSNPGKCHPGTRQKIIERIVSWIDEINPPQRVLCVYGPPGSGKSALAQTICELLRHTRPAQYGGSFFFDRGPTDRGNRNKLIMTLSYQLAVHFPSIRSEINSALKQNISLTTKLIEAQIFPLIIQPLLQCQTFPSNPPTIVIDALDECDENDDVFYQRNIIALILKLIRDHNIPLRFIILSCPEYWIRNAFNASPLSSITMFLSLQDVINTNRDIKMYLTEEFEQIRLENKPVMASVPLPWPPTKVIDRFVYDASGQYVYASTILKFVGKFSKSSNPQDQLRIITNITSPRPHRASAFSVLDRLYETILATYPRWETMKRVLGGLLLHSNLTFIEVVLGVDHVELALILDALSSLINIEKRDTTPISKYEALLEPIFGSIFHERDQIHFCHLSFREFLKNEQRSGPFHVKDGDLYDEVSGKFFGIICHNINGYYETEPHASLNVDLTTYRKIMFEMIREYLPHCARGILLSLVSDLTKRLRLLDPARQMKYPACFIQDMELVIEIKDWCLWDKQSSRWNTTTSKLLSAISELQDTALLARRRGIHLLSFCNNFRITSSLVFINIFRNVGLKMFFTKLFNIPGTLPIDDTLLTLQQHRYLIRPIIQEDERRFIDLLDISSDSEDNVNTGSISRVEWKNQRVLLVYRYLNSMINNFDNGWEQYDDGYNNIKTLVLGQFFHSGYLSDICDEHYFRNQYNVSMLLLIVEPTAWASLLPVRPTTWTELGSVIGPVLCWFNRQLTNKETLELLENYDKTLLWKMKMTVKEMFESCFTPFFTTPYYSGLWVSQTSSTSTRRSIKIQVSPIYEISCLAEETDYLPPDYHRCHSLLRVHDELFGMTPSGMVADQSIIERSSWYPRFAAFLLNVLVKYLYCRVNPTFQGLAHADIIDGYSSYIIQCLPYAQRTEANLDAIRAIAYLYPQVNLKSPNRLWHPPAGFWLLLLDFLKKYERSILSLEELNLLEWWLYSTTCYA